VPNAWIENWASTAEHYTPSARLVALAEDAARGRLRHGDAVALIARDVLFDDDPDEWRRRFDESGPVARAWWITRVGFLIPTDAWLDSLARAYGALGISEVLEVGAPRPMLAKPMRERGIVWSCVDLEPIELGVTRRDGVEAAREFAGPGRGLFCSWPPLGDRLDLDLALVGLPLLILGEACGGCTGSMALHANADAGVFALEEASDVWTGFVDPPIWFGLHDRTWVVADQAMLNASRGRWPCP